MTRIFPKASTASRTPERFTVPEKSARRFRWRRALAAAFVALAFALALAPGARAVSLSAEEQELAAFLAGDRGQQRNRSRMTLDPILTAVARSRAADMARRRYFSHTDPDGNGPNFLARSAGYELPSSWGKSRGGNFIESIGAGQATPGAAWDMWMRSSMHRTHLLALTSFYRDQTHFGVGVYSDPASPFRHYWVIITAPPTRAGTYTGRGTTGAIRVSAAVPVPLINFDEETTGAPRPSVPNQPGAPEKLWNWTGPADALPPIASGPGAR
jgi:uncharacterized protein YkwD